MATPIPWTIKQIISISVEVEKKAVDRSENKDDYPEKEDFFDPRISDILPMGIRMTPTTRYCAAAIQLARMISAWKSRLISGRATLRAELKK